MAELGVYSVGLSPFAVVLADSSCNAHQMNPFGIGVDGPKGLEDFPPMLRDTGKFIGRSPRS